MKKIIGIIIMAVTLLPLTACNGGGGGGGEVFDPEKAKNLIVACKAKSIASTYQYDYTASASIKFPLFKVSAGTIKGETLYNGKQYLQKRINSGALLIDSTTYTFNQGNDLIKIDAKKEDFEVINKENFSPSYDFESNSIGKLFKSLVKDDILEIKDDKSDAHKFNISLGHTTFKNKFLSILNIIDLTVVWNTLNKVAEDKWGLSFKPNCYFILDDANTYVKNFHFDLNLDFKDIVNVTFKLEQNFSKVDGSFDIHIPDFFKDCYITSEAIDNNLVTLKQAIDVSKEHYYKYSLKTAVDHGFAKGNPLGLAVNSTTAGFAERAVKNGQIYFHNELEVDSDYKNDDQYPDVIEDYEFTRARISSNDSVWDVKDKAIGKERHEVKNYNNDEVDDYYMMPKTKWFSSQYVKALRKTKNVKDNSTTWKLGLSSDAIKEILTTYNDSIRLDRDGKKWIDVYEIDSNFNVKNFDFIVVTDDSINNLLSLKIEGKGAYTMKTNEILKEKDDVKFGFDLEIDHFDYNKTYEIPESEEDIDARI